MRGELLRGEGTDGAGNDVGGKGKGKEVEVAGEGKGEGMQWVERFVGVCGMWEGRVVSASFSFIFVSFLFFLPSLSPFFSFSFPYLVFWGGRSE